MENKRNKGYYYEEKAVEFLKEKNLKLLSQNFYGKKGEIDLILKDEETIVFVEVKYRKSNTFGYGAEAVDRRKARRIYLTAMEYLEKYKYTEFQVRFDLVSIDKEEISWIKNIIWGDNIGF